MKSNRVLWALTVFNLGCLAYQAAPSQKAHAEDDAPMLRGRGLEIVDDQGRLRVQMKVEPANATYKMPDGTTGYPETVIFRLITPDGKPRVKLTTSVDGSGLMLLGDSDTTHTILQADGKETSLKLRNNEETQKVLKP
ncbi:MAG: hypothetical protein AAB074_03675 [Planctomycetota bacterium]